MSFTPINRDEGFTPLEKTGFTPIKQSTSIIDDVIYPFKKTYEITDEEVQSGIQKISEGLALPASEVVQKIMKIGLGSLQATFSPLTGFTRAFMGEPTQQISEKAGLSPETSQTIGTGVEMAGTLLAPMAATKLATQAISKGEPFLKQTLEKSLAPVSTARPEDVLKKPETTKIGGTDVEKVLEKFNTTDDISNVFANTAKQIEGQVLSARRGKITWDEAEAAGRLLAVSADDLIKRKPGTSFNVEQLEGMKLVLKKATEEVHAAAVKAVSGTDADLLKFQQYMDRYYAATNAFLGARAEAGRSLNILRKGFASTDDLQSVMQAIGGRDTLLEKAALIAKAETPEQIAAGVKLLRQSNVSDAAMELWINMLLSGPQTHAVNTLSNTLTSFWVVPERAIASIIGKFHQGEKVFARETTHKLFGMAQGVKEGARAGIKTFLTEQPSDLLSKIELARPRAISAEGFGLVGKSGVQGVAGKGLDALGKVARIPGRALMAEDEFFKAVAFRSELNALAMREGLTQGLKGRGLAEHIKNVMADPPKEMFDAALNEARYVTFTKPLGRTGLAIQQFAASHPAAKILIPFVRTPTNIIKFAGERTPLALFSKAVRNEISKGGAARDMALARMGWGTTIMAGIAMHAAEGNITGGGPSDPDARAAKYRTGWQPYSFKFKDEYYSYARLEPLGVLLGISADFAEISGEADKKDAEEIASLIVASASKNITSKTWLRGLSNAIEALDDPDRYVSQFVANLGGTVVPTGVAQIARTQDPILRDARNIVDRIKSRVPGYSKTLPPRRNLWGEAIVLEGGVGPDIISPVYVSHDRHDKVNHEIVRLEMKPSMPERKINGVELTPREYEEYIKLSGIPAKRILDDVINSNIWDKIPDFEKKKIIDEQIKDHRNNARDLMIANNPEKFEITPAREKTEKEILDIRRARGN